MKSMYAIYTLLFISITIMLVPGETYAREHLQHLDTDSVTFVKSETKKDKKLEEAFSSIFQLNTGDVNYYYNRVDLNNDGNPETFVYLSGPTVCGTGGCSGLIFQEENQEYKLLSRFSLVRTPIIVSEKSTNGWKDIIMYVAGGGMTPSYKKLIFKDGSYPLNPSIQPTIPVEQIKGIAIISDKMTADTGIPY